MKTLVTLAFCFFGMIADAQSLVDYSWQFAPTNSANNNLMIDLAGSPLKVKKKADVDGSPFFKEDYCDATYYGADGRIYRGIASKLNLQTNTISFLRQEENEEKEYTPSFQIKKIVFTGCTDKTGPVVFQLGFPAIGIQSDNSYYQVLDSGKTMLLKFSQVIETANPVNGLTQSGGTTSLQKIDIYYIYSPDKG
ncbi:MAG: hypothetical protein JWQ30_1740, partial [Sediminibacterium sp.]|nr:hypothetical protein [Sediminibacterium sp.]